MLLICPCRSCRWTKSFSLFSFFLFFLFLNEAVPQRGKLCGLGGCAQVIVLFQGMLLQTLLHFCSEIFKQIPMPVCFSCSAQSKCRQQCFVIYNLWSLTALELWCFWGDWEFYISLISMQNLKDVGRWAAQGTVSSCRRWESSMATWLCGCSHCVGSFPPRCVFLGSSPIHLLMRVSAMWCQPGFQTITPWNNPPWLPQDLEPRPLEAPLLCQNWVLLTGISSAWDVTTAKHAGAGAWGWEYASKAVGEELG